MLNVKSMREHVQLELDWSENYMAQYQQTELQLEF